MISDIRDYERDFAFGLRFAPEVERIVRDLVNRKFSITLAPFRLDTQQATDLVVAYSGPHAIAMRVRRPVAFRFDYRKEITIRSHRESGAETELAKIAKGFGDWFFYGFGNEG